MPKGDNAGRPFGSYTLDEPKSARLEISITPTASQWLKSQGRGWLGQLLEEMARGLIEVPEISATKEKKESSGSDPI